MNNTFLLFYSPKPWSQVWILIFRKWSITGLYLLWNLRNYMWMTKSQLCVKRICLSPTHYIKRYKQRKQKTTTIAVRFYLLQICPSLPPFALICRVNYTFFLRFERLFLCFTQFGGSSYCLSFDKHRTSSPFKSNNTDLWWSVTRHPKGRIHQRYLSLKHKQMKGKFSKTSRGNLKILSPRDSILTISINSTLWHEHE